MNEIEFSVYLDDSYNETKQEFYLLVFVIKKEYNHTLSEIIKNTKTFVKMVLKNSKNHREKIKCIHFLENFKSSKLKNLNQKNYNKIIYNFKSNLNSKTFKNYFFEIKAHKAKTEEHHLIYSKAIKELVFEYIIKYGSEKFEVIFDILLTASKSNKLVDDISNDLFFKNIEWSTDEKMMV